MAEILNIIKNIYSGENGLRSENIQKLQILVEENDFSDNEEIEYLLIRLSEGLDFYVENPTNRSEDPSYFGNEELKNRLFYFLLDLEKMRNGRSVTL